MAFLGWIVLGLLAGFIAGNVQETQKKKSSIALDLPLGIIGAVVGGLIFDNFGAPGLGGSNFYSLFVALAGSIFVLTIYHYLLRRA